MPRQLREQCRGGRLVGVDVADYTCPDCGIAITGQAKRCRSCADKASGLAKRAPVRPCRTCHQEIQGRNRAKNVYCNVTCKFADPEMRKKMAGRKPNFVIKNCPACKQDFQVNVSMANRYNYCSRACSATRSTDETCLRCGTRFRRSLAEVRKHCSETCRRPPLILTCAHCGEQFRTVPSSEGRRRFCTAHCYRASDAETSIERAVRLLLDDAGLAYEPQVRIGRWVVDFLVGGRLAIETDGSYWHTLRPEVDRRKDTALARRGLTVWRLPEAEIMHATFAEAFQRRIAEYERVGGSLPQADLIQLARPPRRQTSGAKKVGLTPPGHAKGERNSHAKLTEADVLAIRSSNESISTLADRYGIAQSGIYKIRRGETWAHVGGPIAPPQRRRAPAIVPLQRSGPLTGMERAAIRASTELGVDLAGIYGVSASTICGIRRGYVGGRPAPQKDAT